MSDQDWTEMGKPRPFAPSIASLREDVAWYQDAYAAAKRTPGMSAEAVERARSAHVAALADYKAAIADE